jgi:amino acid adenylation domain-containing protein
MGNSPERTGQAALDEPGSPLSYTQESLWLLHRMSQDEAPAYNEPLAFRLTGELDISALRTALRRVVERHEALRTRFVETEHGLRALVQDTAPDVLEVADLRAHDPEKAGAPADELMGESYRRPFDLSTGPLLRALLVLLPDGENLFGLTAHHIVTDAWSNGLIVEEIGTLYAGLARDGRPAALPAPAVGYAEFAEASRREFESGAHTEKIARWKSVLDNGPELLRLHLDHPRPPVRTFTGSSVTVTAPRAEVTALLDRCRRESRSTDFATLLAAYAVLLHRHTGQDAVNIATTVLNRHTEEQLTAVGCYVNTAVLTLDLEPDLTFRELLVRAEQATDRLLDDGDVPWPKVLDQLDIARDPSHNPVFQTMLTLLGRKPLLDLGEDVTVRPHRVTRASAKFELLLYVSENDDAFELEAEFNTDLFAPGTVERLLRHYAHLLKALAGELDTPVSAVSFLPEDEKHLILDVWNDTAVDYPRSTVIDTMEEQVRRTPDAIAVEFEGSRLTYDQLDRRANQVARVLRGRRSPDAGPFVGVYMERSVEMVVALVAVMKAGCAYVPVDPDYPADRVEFMIEDAGLALILTQEHHRAALAGSGADLLVLGPGDTSAEDDRALARDLSPDSPVYMIYTSGSTGRPKGVVNRHVSLFNRLFWMQSEFGLTGEDRILQKTPFSFDVSVWEFFWPLMFGARVVVARPGGHRDADYLKRVIHARKVTTVHFVPSLLNVFLEEDELAAYCVSLRRVICSGEALAYQAVEKFGATLDCGLHNLYGPTEAAIDVTHWPCTPDYPGLVVPIGRPIANLRLYVMDRERRLLPVGVPGELCIGGVGVAAGYHRREELNRTVFVTDPYGIEPGARLYRTGDLARFLPDGQIQYLGRIDNQIKLRGLRIEPEEIAAVLREAPSVRDSAVLLHESGAGKALVGYVVADAFDSGAIRKYLASRLPEFMVPQVVMEIPRIPTTPNGKLDRRALPKPFEDAAQRTVTPPSTAHERDVAQVWREVMGLETVDVDTDFFRYGGDSILSITVVARLRELGYRIDIRDVFARPTIRSLADALTEDADDAPGSEVAPFALLAPADRERLPAGAQDAWPLTRLQSAMIYHTMLDEASAVYHDIFDYEIVGPVRPDVFRRAVLEVVARHPQLRSTMDLDGYQVPLQMVHAEAEVPVVVTDVSGLDRAGQDGAVDQWVEREKQRPFDLDRPLIRFQLHVRAQDRMNVSLSFHHAILDGWSVALVMEEIRRGYADLLVGRERALPTESLGYGSYVVLERQAMERPGAGRFWQDLLTDFPATTVAASRAAGTDADGPLPGGPMIPVTREHDLDPTLTRGLEESAARLRVPVKSLYLAAHCTALSRVTGGSRIVSGVVGNGRPEVRGGTELVGLFLNTLAFPVDTGAARGDDLVREVFALEQRLMPERRFPMGEVQRLTGTDALFDVVFNYTDFHVYDGGGRPGAGGVRPEPRDQNDIRITRARYFELTSFPLVVHAHRDHFTGRMGLALRYDAARVDASVTERYLDVCLAALSGLAADSADAPGTAGDRTTRLPATAAADTGAVARPGAPSGDTPATEMERRIAEIVADSIGGRSLGVERNYLDQGVDSITAIRILAKIRKISPGVGMGDVIGLRTIRALARRAEQTAAPGTAEAAPLRPFELAGADARSFPADAVDAYPMTALQLDMVRATDRDPAQAAYHDVFGYHLALPLDEPLLRDVLRTAVDSCETLRTSLVLDARPLPLQVLHERVEPELTVLADPDGSAFERWSVRERGTGFDWSRPGLMRFTAHRRADGHFVLALSFHHAVIDGWSLSLFVRDLVRRYVAALAGQEVPAPTAPAVRYRDYVRAELAARDSREAREHWREVLADHPGTELPDFAPVEPASRWAETRFDVAPALQEGVQALASKLGVTPRHVLLACHLRTLAAVAGVPDVVTGVFTHGRPGSEGGDEVLGMFLNFLPHRARVGRQSWAEFIREVFDADRGVLAHRHHPLAAIREDMERDRLFPALFNYTEFQAYAEVAGGATGGPHARYVTDITWFEHTDIPLLVNAGRDVRQQRTVITLNANGAAIPQPALEAIAGLYHGVLTHLVTEAEAPVAHVGEEMARLLKEVRQHILSEHILSEHTAETLQEQRR